MKSTLIMSLICFILAGCGEACCQDTTIQNKEQQQRIVEKKDTNTSILFETTGFFKNKTNLIEDINTTCGTNCMEYINDLKKDRHYGEVNNTIEYHWEESCRKQQQLDEKWLEEWKICVSELIPLYYEAIQE